MSYGPLDTSKAAPGTFHTLPSMFNGGGFTRNVGAAALNVAKGIGSVAHLAGSGAKAFGKAVTGQDDFTKQVSAQAKAGRGKY